MQWESGCLLPRCFCHPGVMSTSFLGSHFCSWQDSELGKINHYFSLVICIAPCSPMKAMHFHVMFESPRSVTPIHVDFSKMSYSQILNSNTEHWQEFNVFKSTGPSPKLLAYFWSLAFYFFCFWCLWRQWCLMQGNCILRLSISSHTYEAAPVVGTLPYIFLQISSCIPFCTLSYINIYICL